MLKTNTNMLSKSEFEMRNLILRSTDVSPKAVPTRNVRPHGLFSISFVRQHLMFDERWSPNSTSEQFQKLTQLLRKRLQFHTLEKETIKAKLQKKYRMLRQQIRLGRMISQQTLFDDNSMFVNNLLSGNKELQRLYSCMTLPQVLESINERTFKMRKERDRLVALLEIEKHKYTNLLKKEAEIENHMKYVDKFFQQNEEKERALMKSIADSNTRMAAIKTINATYRKILQILKCDAKFYEPILISLDDDIRDQECFIKNILHLGTPAINRYRELKMEYRLKEDRARKNFQSFRDEFFPKGDQERVRPSNVSLFLRRNNEKSKGKRFQAYVRETSSMLALKQRLKAVEETIKKVKFATLRSQALALYPQIKNQIDNNYHLRKMIESDMLGKDALEAKEKCATVVQEILYNNLAEEEFNRVNVIERMKESIKEADEYQEKALRYIKTQSELFVLLRYSLWNIHDILRYVAPVRAHVSKYPNCYLKLPLLKFEMLNMRAVAPEPYEEDIIQLVKVAKQKMKVLLGAFNQLNNPNVSENRNTYEELMREEVEIEIPINEEISERNVLDFGMEESKNQTEVPNRKQIKINSAKIIEESQKKDD